MTATTAINERIDDLRAKCAEYIGETESRDEYQDAMRGWLSTADGRELAGLIRRAARLDCAAS